MPRAPKPCRKRTADADVGEVSKEPQKARRESQSLPKVVETLVKSFKSWVATGQGTTALPLEQIEKLSHEIWEVKMSSWKCETGKDVADLACVSALDDVVTAVFKAIEKKCLTAGDLEKNRCKASVVKLQNSSAGLVLAAMILDLSAFQQPSREQAKATSPQIQPGEEVVARAMSFLWHQARFALPTLLESKASTEAASTCAGLARTIRSIHHILAARRYTSNALPAACLAHKAAPMAAQCVTLAASLTSTSAACIKTALATLGEASSDLLVGLSGYGCAESALQSFAMTEFGRLATLSSMFVNSLSANSKGSGRGAQHGPSFLALVLRAIGAPLLPLGLYSKDPKDLSHMAVERVAAADTRAGHLAAVVIQHSLLESERSEAMHALVQQLCAACGDPFWAAAPLYALRLVGALSRVAGASRMIDLDCSQREEATRLLAKAAEILTISAHEAKQVQMCRCCGAEAGPDCELCMLKAWAPERKHEGKSIKLSKDPLALVISLVDAAAADDGLLAPASARWAAGELQGSALSANNARCNAAALLCLSLASPMACKKRKDAKSVAATKAPEWNLQTWAAHSCVDGGSSKTPSSKEIRCAISLYRRLQWSDPTSILSRMSALECLLSLARSNPLAHVRRQALCGLSACCVADPQLIASRCVAEAVAAGLQDEAAFARLASLDLVAQLQCPEGEMNAVVLPRLTELRLVVRSKLSDPSVLVRRAAFRAAGVWLEECQDPSAQIQEAGEMLRRLRNESLQIRSQALSVLERVVFSKGSKMSKQHQQDTILQRLCTLHGHNGVGGAGVRDVLSAHCKAIEGNANLSDAAGIATAAMEEIASCALKSLPDGAETEKLELHLSLLEQLSLERPAAFHKHLNRFAQWLQEQTSPDTPESLVLPIAACNILAQVLPSWTQSASTLSKQKMANTLTEKLSYLLGEETAPSNDLGQLARVVVKCLAVVVEHLSSGARDLLMGHFGRSIRILSEAMQQMEQLSHGKMCRHTWMVGSLLEFLDSKSMELLGEAIAQVSCKNGALDIVSKAAVSLLSDCCLRGPAAAKPAMIPALGFALRRFPQLLDDGSHGSDGSGAASAPLSVLRHGLSAESSSNAASVLRLRATETFAGLAACYQEAAEVNGPSKKKDNSASVAAQKLATLQPELMAVLQAEEKTIQQALRGFRSLCDLGVIHPASAIPGIITVTVAGTKAAARHARQLLLRLVESGPPLLAQRCGAGLRAAAHQLGDDQEVYSQSWRFGPLCQAYGEFLEGKQPRDQFLCSLVSEAFSETEGSSMLRLQLIAGLLARLPLSKEAELARIVHSVVQFLTLKVAPYLTLDDQEKADKENFPPPSRATCAAAVVFHKLCTHWLDLVGAEFTKQMRETWGSTLSLSTDFDQALPIAFSRQNLPDLAGLFQTIASGETDEALLAKIETDSPLLNSKAAARALAIKPCSQRSGK